MQCYTCYANLFTFISQPRRITRLKPIPFQKFVRGQRLISVSSSNVQNTQYNTKSKNSEKNNDINNQVGKQNDDILETSEGEEEGEEQQSSNGGPFTRARKLVQLIFLSIQRIIWGFFGILKSILPFGQDKGRVLGILTTLTLGALFVTSADLGSQAKNAKYPREVSYSKFVQYVQEGQVKTVRIEDNTQRVYFSVVPPITTSTPTPTSTSTPTDISTNTPQEKPIWYQNFFTRAISNDVSMVPMLVKAGVDFGVLRATLGSTISRVLGTALALWLPLIPFIFLWRRFLDGRMGGKRKGQKGQGAPKPPPVTFANVAGVDTAVEELTEVVQCLKEPQRYQKVKATMPSGVLLCGPPGTGKTLLAKAVAGEAGVPFYATSASEFVEMFVGRGAARIRELFAEARKRAPAVVFIDELDAVGSRRGLGFNDERDQTLNQLLTELDGFEDRTGVLLLAATNRQDVLDPALLRPGRISRKITVPLPDEKGRKAILQVHMRDKPFSEDDEGKDRMSSQVAQLTYGFSGADLANVVNEAALMAVRKDSDFIQLSDILEGVRRTRFGVNGRSMDLGKGLQGFLNRLRQSAQPAQATYGS